MRRLILGFLVGFLSLLPVTFVRSASFSLADVGFTADGLQFSEPQAIGDTMRVYSYIQNRTADDVVGTVQLYVNGQKYAEQEVKIIQGTTQGIWFDVIAASTTLRAYERLVEAGQSSAGLPTEPISTRVPTSSFLVMTLPTIIPPASTTVSTSPTSSPITSGPTSSPVVARDSFSVPTTSITSTPYALLDHVVAFITSTIDSLLHSSSSAASIAAIASTIGNNSLPAIFSTTSTNTGSSTSSVATTSSFGAHTWGELVLSSTPALAASTSGQDSNPAGRSIFSQAVSTTRQIIQAMSSAIIPYLKTTQDHLADDARTDPNPQPIGLFKQAADALHERQPYISIPDKSLPTGKVVQAWLLGAVIWALNTWWLMLIIYLLIFRLLWKLWRSATRRADDGH